MTTSSAREALLDARQAIAAQVDTLNKELKRIDAALRAWNGEDAGASAPRRRSHNGKYVNLWAHLSESSAPEIPMTFQEIEELLGFSLPASSRKHLPHWHSYDGSAVVRAVHDAGYRASQVDLESETVNFVRG